MRPAAPQRLGCCKPLPALVSEVSQLTLSNTTIRKRAAILNPYPPIGYVPPPKGYATPPAGYVLPPIGYICNENALRFKALDREEL
jgi:hypothetical protein